MKTTGSRDRLLKCVATLHITFISLELFLKDIFQSIYVNVCLCERMCIMCMKEPVADIEQHQMHLNWSYKWF